MAESGPPGQPNIVRKPEKKPADFRATSQQQSNAGTYDDRGGDRFKKVLLWAVILILAAAVITIIVDVIAGRGPI